MKKIEICTLYEDGKNKVEIKTRTRGNHYITIKKYIIDGNIGIENQASTNAREASEVHSKFVRLTLEKLAEKN